MHRGNGRPASQSPGAWAGAIVRSEDDTIFVSVSQERWDKAKRLVQKSVLEVEEGKKHNYKQMESYRGFLVYVGMTYPLILSHLKGMHLTLAAHHPNRDDEGWKMVKEVETKKNLESRLMRLKNWLTAVRPPIKVKGVPRLHMTCRL